MSPFFFLLQGYVVQTGPPTGILSDARMIPRPPPSRHHLTNTQHQAATCHLSPTHAPSSFLLSHLHAHGMYQPVDTACATSPSRSWAHTQPALIGSTSLSAPPNLGLAIYAPAGGTQASDRMPFGGATDGVLGELSWGCASREGLDEALVMVTCRGIAEPSKSEK
ncbi:uncharacterized protein BDZ99DRAFT_131348 [Mytilinidion resinicola]|uniref:Uncharacterized protein n=1 Tax=Mytilinidion resinicola TaxID=574789 RepID=A0A6A6Z6B8_9PEZI|nr:uncharacterized protein BDZ99DRAFT_131348 [Mytilinidion resinicola]KAF2816213.1 hypothetical protein BDZ99DRAFT_131348 [Mytilinidion resinicola]